MQANQVKERFSSIERSIDNAAQLCQTNASVPEGLRTCLRELDQQSDKAKQAINSRNEAQILQCVDELESLGDRAMKECRQASSNIDQKLTSAVQQAHDAISQLKHQLH